MKNSESENRPSPTLNKGGLGGFESCFPFPLPRKGEGESKSVILCINESELSNPNEWKGEDGDR
jgi:hypothetical protein